jgi:hypothetical protein
MKVGGSFVYQGQRYECVGSFDYVRPETWIQVFELRSVCPDCGRPFSCSATQSQRKNGSMPRRCERCRSPGRPVAIARGRDAEDGRRARLCEKRPIAEITYDPLTTQHRGSTQYERVALALVPVVTAWCSFPSAVAVAAHV